MKMFFTSFLNTRPEAFKSKQQVMSSCYIQHVLMQRSSLTKNVINAISLHGLRTDQILLKRPQLFLHYY